MDYDVLVVGGGIAGMESGLTLGDMGYKVLLVEKEVSIGGKMILLSKVFPTLDCSSCISTPKMAATAHHPNLTVLTYSEVEGIVRKDDGTFAVRLLKKPTFVDPAACTGCGDCELACTVAISDKFNADLVATRAAHIAFPQAVPKKAVIERAGSSPCNFTCPAGVKAHGYVSLVRSGKYEEAFRLHMEDAPLPGSLSRACYAPCEGQCTRDEVEGKVPIRGIKRFMVDTTTSGTPSPSTVRRKRGTGKRSPSSAPARRGCPPRTSSRAGDTASRCSRAGPRPAGCCATASLRSGSPRSWWTGTSGTSPPWGWRSGPAQPSGPSPL